MNIKIKGLLILALISVCTFAQAQLTDYSIFDQKFNFYICLLYTSDAADE